MLDILSQEETNHEACATRPSHSLPVRLLLFTLFGATVLFFLAWSLDLYYVPYLWRNQPH
jgi:hypothetical protein